MPRRATFALGIVAVLFSAGTVGSQDPYRARSEAESAEHALPIYAPDRMPAAEEGPSSAWQATHAPMQIVPGSQPGGPAPQPAAPPSELEQNSSRAATAPPGVASIALAAPALSAYLAGHAQGALTARDVPSSWDPRAIAPAADAPVQEQAVTPAEPSTEITSQLTPLSAERASGKAAIAQKRLFATVPDDITPYFDLFMYVSKAKRGPLAQHMFVFQRDSDGQIIPYAEWEVSTGRERLELHKNRRVRTNTPEGIFQIDPDRMHVRYWSRSWDNAPMHYAMFYDMLNNGRQTGLAIHAAIGQAKINRLGRRDSAGCVRLAPKHAKELFYKVQTATRGQVPVLAINESGSTDRWGRVQRDGTGAMMLQDGYRAVLFVENFDGREEMSGPVIAYTH